MAVQVINLFSPSQLTGSAATLYTVPNTPSGLVLGRVRLRFTNTDSVQHAVTAYAIPSGGSATAANACLSAYVVPSNSFIDVDMPNLGVSGFYQAFADTATEVTVHCLNAVLFS